MTEWSEQWTLRPQIQPGVHLQAGPIIVGEIEVVLKQEAEQKIEEARERGREHCEQWYAVRWERLRDLTRDRSKAAEPGSEMAQIWADIASIMANGTLGPPDHPYEPPTYAQQLNIAKYRAKEAEAERDQALKQGAAEGRERLEKVLLGNAPKSAAAATWDDAHSKKMARFFADARPGEVAQPMENSDVAGKALEAALSAIDQGDSSER